MIPNLSARNTASYSLMVNICKYPNHHLHRKYQETAMMPEFERSDLGLRLLGFRVEELGFIGLTDNLGLFCFSPCKHSFSRV